MNQTAQIINFEKPIVKADIDNGFDRVAGKLTDTLANPPCSLSGREYQVIHAIISKSYRYHKKTDWVASVQLAEITSIDKTNVSKIKTKLIRKKVLIEDGKKIGINPTVSEWCDEPNQAKPLKVVKNDYVDNSQKRLLVQSKMTRVQSKTTTTVVNSDPHNRKTILQKTIIQKTIESLPLPDFLNQTSWNEFIQHRNEQKKPLTELAATKFIKKLSKEHLEGHNVIEMIDASIANGWLTTYPPKQNAFAKNRAQPENFANKDYGQSTFTGGQ